MSSASSHHWPAVSVPPAKSPRAPKWYTRKARSRVVGHWKRLGTRWASRTSNPVSGSRQAGGGFDSHTLPPPFTMGQYVRRSGTSQPSHARGWVIAAAVSAAVTVLALTGYFAYRAQASLPGTKLPDLGNRHVQTVETPHEPYNS